MKIVPFGCLFVGSISTALNRSALRIRHLVVLLACAFAATGFWCVQIDAQTAHFGPATGVSFGSVNVKNTSAVSSLSFTFDTGGKLGSTAVLTQGAIGLDFADAGTGTCTTNGFAHTYNPGDTCTLNVTFSPKFAGTRYGAAVLKDSAGNAIASGYIYGTGIGSQVAFPPGVLTTIASTGLNHPIGVAVDGSGNVFVNDTQNNRVLKEAPSGASYTESVVVSVGLASPFGIAVDGAGNLYVVDALNRRVLKETVSASGYTETVLVGTNLHSPTSVAVDGSGNVYYADTPSNSGSLGVQRVIKKTLSGGTYTDSTVADLSTGLDNPYGVAVDGAGNVYIADTDIGKVWKETLSGSTYTQTTIGTGLNHPNGVTVDGKGNVYIADRGNLRVLKEAPVGAAYTETVMAAFVASWGIAVDGSGNLYFSDYDKSTVSKLDLGDPPTLNFANTNVGATSTDSPQTATVQNIGNANLTFPVPSSGRNPSISAGFTLGGTGTCPQLGTSSSAGTLAPGNSCTLLLSFSPTVAGLIHGTLVLTDDALNVTASTTQTILLNGTGIATTTTPQAVLSPASLAFGNLTTGTTSAAQTITLSNPGTAALSITSISVTGANTAQFAQTSACGASLAAGASCTISVTFTPSAVASYSAAVSVADNATGSPQSVTLTGAGVAPAAPQAVLSPASLAFGSLTTGLTSAAQTVTLSNPGTAALSITGISVTGAGSSVFAQTNSCGTTLAAGASCSISVTFTPNAAAGFAASISVADNATGSPQSVTLAGTGVAPAVPQAVLSPASLAFGNVTTGTTSAAQTVTLSNPGTAALSITGITITGANTAQFAQTTTCGASLAVGASCNIVVTFTPAAAANYSAAISVADNVTGSPQTAQLAGAGVAPVVADFSIAASNSPQTVSRGTNAVYPITVTPLNGALSNGITLSISGLPVGATSSFSPASVTPAGSAATSTLTVGTTNVAALSVPHLGESQIGGRGAMIALGILLLPWIRVKRMRQSTARLLSALVLFAGLTCLWGCGAGGFAGHSQQTYVLTVTGTSGSIQHSTTVTLILQ